MFRISRRLAARSRGSNARVVTRSGGIPRIAVLARSSSRMIAASAFGAVESER
jgi:hypothetical protein